MLYSVTYYLHTVWDWNFYLLCDEPTHFGWSTHFNCTAFL